MADEFDWSQLPPDVVVVMLSKATIEPATIIALSKRLNLQLGDDFWVTYIDTLIKNNKLPFKRTDILPNLPTQEELIDAGQLLFNIAKDKDKIASDKIKSEFAEMACNYLNYALRRSTFRPNSKHWAIDHHKNDPVIHLNLFLEKPLNEQDEQSIKNEERIAFYERLGAERIGEMDDGWNRNVSQQLLVSDQKNIFRLAAKYFKEVESSLTPKNLEALPLIAPKLLAKDTDDSNFELYNFAHNLLTSLRRERFQRREYELPSEVEERSREFEQKSIAALLGILQFKLSDDCQDTKLKEDVVKLKQKANEFLNSLIKSFGSIKELTLFFANTLYAQVQDGNEVSKELINTAFYLANSNPEAFAVVTDYKNSIIKKLSSTQVHQLATTYSDNHELMAKFRKSLTENQLAKLDASHVQPRPVVRSQTQPPADQFKPTQSASATAAAASAAPIPPITPSQLSQAISGAGALINTLQHAANLYSDWYRKEWTGEDGKEKMGINLTRKHGEAGQQRVARLIEHCKAVKDDPNALNKVMTELNNYLSVHSDYKTGFWNPKTRHHAHSFSTFLFRLLNGCDKANRNNTLYSYTTKTDTKKIALTEVKAARDALQKQGVQFSPLASADSDNIILKTDKTREVLLDNFTSSLGEAVKTTGKKKLQPGVS